VSGATTGRIFGVGRAEVEAHYLIEEKMGKRFEKYSIYLLKSYKVGRGDTREKDL
jgi:hypothetical protein